MIVELSRKALLRLDPETAHHLAILGLRRFAPAQTLRIPDGLSLNVWGKHFTHPVGMAAGFDKDAEAYQALARLGFSFVEVGSVTPQPQPGNPRPRLFRLKDDRAIINRYGFNSKGMAYVQQRLINHKGDLTLGVNLGKNKTSANDMDDFIKGAETLISFADYLTINLSSPNTPGLRDLQQAASIDPLLRRLDTLRQQRKPGCPLLIKLSPDMAPGEESELLAYLARSVVDGIIISNTTTSRDSLNNLPSHLQTGGLSGTPLQKKSRDMLQRAYTAIGNSKPIIASGGINSGEEAYLRICMGATLCQIYTAFIYDGPSLIPAMLKQMKACMQRDGFSSIDQARGSYYVRRTA
ncbi:quinone-dependent dihydroorotate dehydrogenase (plasmid) [Chimaeribacter arupi]|uniref:Dihydroorotate dehydrogenase (quinone) n=2 Tax=Yersiniaceae TaxID=1903411 RepID=A0ABS5JHS1_9GAMM|nr:MULTISPECIES: quinone-dependent dihydroorotate dehydrogenase [Yersiniaceae]MBS0969379.1 quinone-dependent dihydroorotate dehydrogenase [Nissabacter archeti]MDV5140167.1 quinone-dependent dihydroorotate dehydrogenase [Chimaeribacter arupi]WKZ94919.1 quinone-dependent dihydroorotate dehydrogenase [Chimaeribacter arupi]